jgi:hypothetical protein
MGYYMTDAIGGCSCGGHCVHPRRTGFDAAPIMRAIDAIGKRVAAVEARRKRAALDAAKPPSKMERALGPLPPGTGARPLARL